MHPRTSLLAASAAFLSLAFPPSRACAQVVTLEVCHVTAPAADEPEVSLERVRLTPHKPIDLAEVLAQEMPSIALIRKGPSAGDFLLRGLGRDNVRVEVDGVAIHGACPNRMDPPAFHVSSQQIDRISVRQGPFEVESGGAIGGVLRVETKACTAAPVQGAFAAGSFGYVSGSLSGGATLPGGGAASASVSYQTGGVYRDGDGLRYADLPARNYRAGVSGGSAFTIDEAEVKAVHRGTGSDSLDVSVGYHLAKDVLYPGLRMDADRDRSYRIAANHRIDRGEGASGVTTLSFHASGVAHTMSDALRTTSLPQPWASRGYMMRTVAHTRALGVRALHERKEGGLALRFGLSADERRWNADNTIMLKKNALLPDVVMRNAGVFGTALRDFGASQWETGARVDLTQSRARSDLGFVQAAQGTSRNARRDLLVSAYTIGSRRIARSNVFAGIGRAQRAPDPQERYQSLDHPSAAQGDWVGNPTLGAVGATEVQAGARIALGAGLTLQMRVFLSWLDNYVYLVPLHPAAGSGAQPTLSKTYAGIDARLLGGEGALEWQPGGNSPWRLRLGAAHQRGEKTHPGPAPYSRVLGEIPETRFLLQARYEQPRWSAELSAQGSPRQDRVDPTLGERPTEGYVSLGATLSWNLSSRTVLTMSAENLLDAQYTLHNAYTRDPFSAGIPVPEPGRFLYARIRHEF